MTIFRQHRDRYIRVVLSLILFLTVSLSAAGLSQDQPRSVRFELRVASMEEVEGWGSVPGLGPVKARIWISPEVSLTNADVAKAWAQSDTDRFRVGIQFTEDGALKLARMTKAHIGEYVAVMIDDRVLSAPMISGEITGGRAFIEGNLTEEEARSLAESITAW